jgi:hypothetical protein
MRTSHSSAVATRLPPNPNQRFNLRVDTCVVTRRGGEVRLGIKLAVMTDGIFQEGKCGPNERIDRPTRGGVTVAVTLGTQIQ